MDAAHFHLILVHIPIVLSWLALPLLLWGAYSADIRKLALLLLLTLGPLLFLAQQSGERAEELVEKLPAFSESIAHEHEEAGEFAVVLGMVVSLASLAVAVYERRRGAPSPTATIVLFVLASALALSLFRTGGLGGQVMHSEIRTGAPASRPEADD